jgi:hypothetical protein
MAAVLLAAIGFCAAAQAGVWNMADDMHASMAGTPANPNGDWTYGNAPSVGGVFSANTVHTGSTAWYPAGAIDGWCYQDNPYLPGVWSVMSDQAAGVLGKFARSTGDMLVHPGIDMPCAVVRWTAPETGVYDVTAAWESLDGDVALDYNHGVDVHLLKNGVSVYDGVTSYYNSTGPAVLGSTILSLTAGDTLDFVTSPLGMDATVMGDYPYGYDMTRVSATITSVPEPSTLVLLGTVLAGLSICIWRKR